MGLDRVRAVAARLGLLPWRIPSIIVAGTNGKGSVTCAAEQILLAHGVPTGAGFSPHLHRFNERIRINGSEAEDALLIAGFEAVERGRAEVPLTYFELATLVSLWAWREAAMRCTVLEVGLGGRLDAFNIVDAEVAVVTSIGIDHQEYLGDTRELIGAEKAGVFRAGQYVVLGRDMPVSVRESAASLGCVVIESGKHIRVADQADAVHMSCLTGTHWRLEGLTETDFPTQLAPHNVALAMLATSVLLPFKRTFEEKIEEKFEETLEKTLDVAAVRSAVAQASMPGRTEQIRRHERCFVLDIAHNPDGAAFLAERLNRLGLTPAAAIFGTLRDKDTSAIAAALAHRIPCWISVPTEGPRGQGAAAGKLALNAAGVERAVAAPDLASAINLAVQETAKDGVILIFGSFSVVGAARLALGASMIRA